jgi:hypothetical protein
MLQIQLTKYLVCVQPTHAQKDEMNAIKCVKSAGPAITRGHRRTLMTLSYGENRADLSYLSDVEKNAAFWEFVRSFVNVNTRCETALILWIYSYFTQAPVDVLSLSAIYRVGSRLK